MAVHGGCEGLAVLVGVPAAGDEGSAGLALQDSMRNDLKEKISNNNSQKLYHRFLTCALLPSWVWLTSTSIDLCPVSAITLDEEPGMKWTDDKSDGGSDALPFSITH